MAEFTHEEEIEIVRKAFTLETAIKVENANIELIKGQEFDIFPDYDNVFNDTPPKRPQHLYAPPAKPIAPAPPKASYSIGEHCRKQPLWPIAAIAGLFLFIFGSTILSGISTLFGFLVSQLGALLLLFGGIACIVTYLKTSKAKNNDLANSPGYLQAVEQARQQAEFERKQLQDQYDAQFEKDMKNYNEFLLPAFEERVSKNKAEYAEMKIEYHTEKAEWEKKRKSALALLENDVDANTSALEEHYNSTKIISIHYREIPLLEWLYDDMRSSDHDIRYATELLDRDRQRIITEEAGMRTASAVNKLRDEVHADLQDVMQLQDIQIEGLRNLEAISNEILFTNEDIYESSKKVLFHQRVNTADKALREWRRHKNKQGYRY